MTTDWTDERIGTAKELDKLEIPDDDQLVIDHVGKTKYMKIPEQGVKVGWSYDNLYVLQEGDLFGFSYTEDSVDQIARATGLIVERHGKVLLPCEIHCIVWSGYNSGHTYVRHVKGTDIRWVRPAVNDLEEWFFMSKDFCVENIPLLTDLVRRGTTNSRFISSVLEPTYVPSGLQLKQPD